MEFRRINGRNLGPMPYVTYLYETPRTDAGLRRTGHIAFGGDADDRRILQPPAQGHHGAVQLRVGVGQVREASAPTMRQGPSPVRRRHRPNRQEGIK